MLWVWLCCEATPFGGVAVFGKKKIIMPKSKKKSRAKEEVPYARGFKPPTAKQRVSAARSNSDKGPLEKAFSDTVAGGLFPPLPRPSSVDDWLAQYKEDGQSYSKFLRECPWISGRKVKYCRMPFEPSGATLRERYPQGKIYLLPLGEFDESAHAPDFSHLADYASRFFELQVEVMPAVELRVNVAQERVLWVEPRVAEEEEEEEVKRIKRRKSERTLLHNLEARFHQRSGHYQLHCGSLLIRLKQAMPADALCLMALTMSDIYDTPPDLFVAGMAAGNHRVGAFSLRRYDPSLTFSSEHWHQITTTTNNNNNTVATTATTTTTTTTETQRATTRTMLQRSCKLLVHEVAHLLGLDHCIWYSCCMNGSGHLAEDFCQATHLCPVDLRKLQRLCGFDVPGRYRRLAEFFRTHGLTEEKRWIETRLAFLEK